MQRVEQVRGGGIPAQDLASRTDNKQAMEERIERVALEGRLAVGRTASPAASLAGGRRLAESRSGFRAQ
jgi:hypothetical protein